MFAVYYLKQSRDPAKRRGMRLLDIGSSETLFLNKLGGFGEVECEEVFIDDIELLFRPKPPERIGRLAAAEQHKICIFRER